MLGQFQRNRLPFSLRSAFVAPALSSADHGDAFGSIDELKMTSRSSISVMDSCVPVLGAGVDAVNNYVVDFYTHGQYEPIVSENRIEEFTLFNKLRSFSLLLRTMSTRYGRVVMSFSVPMLY